MASARKVIITCAVTGSIHTPSMSPHLPLTPDEIAKDAVAAAEATAATFCFCGGLTRPAVCCRKTTTQNGRQPWSIRQFQSSFD